MRDLLSPRHHIYTVGLEIESKIYYTNLTLIISLPTGTKIYNWYFDNAKVKRKS